MRIIKTIFFCFILFSSAMISAQEITVLSGNLSYQLNSSKNLISFKSQDVDLSIGRKKCNAQIVDKFNARFEKLIARPFLNSSRSDFIEVKINGVKGFETKYSDRGISLLKMYEMFKELKIKESLSCPE